MSGEVKMSFFLELGAGALLRGGLISERAVPLMPAASDGELAGTNRANESSGKACFDNAECSRFRA